MGYFKVLTLTVTPEGGRSPPSLVQTAGGQGSVVTATDRMMGGLSCWMNENPTHGSVSVMYEVTTAGGTGMGTKCIVHWLVTKYKINYHASQKSDRRTFR